jgi:hypothetical protein
MAKAHRGQTVNEICSRQNNIQCQSLTAKRRVQARRRLQNVQNFSIIHPIERQRRNKPASKDEIVKTFEETAEVIDRNGTPTQAKKEGRGTKRISKHKDVRCFYKVVLNLPASARVCERQRRAIFCAFYLFHAFRICAQWRYNYHELFSVY